MTIDKAARELDRLKGLFHLLPEPGFIFEEWERFVTTCEVSGKNTHDSRLSATMRLHGIEKILTFNTGDFRRFPGYDRSRSGTVLIRMLFDCSGVPDQFPLAMY